LNSKAQGLKPWALGAETLKIHLFPVTSFGKFESLEGLNPIAQGFKPWAKEVTLIYGVRLL